MSSRRSQCVGNLVGLRMTVIVMIRSGPNLSVMIVPHVAARMDMSISGWRDRSHRNGCCKQQSELTGPLHIQLQA